MMLFYGRRVSVISLTPTRKVRPSGADSRESHKWQTELRADFLTEFLKNLSPSFTPPLWVQILSSTHFCRFLISITKLESERKCLAYTFPGV